MFYQLCNIDLCRIAKLYDSKDVTDPFVDVILGKAKIAKTSVILNNLNPEWNEFYRIDVCHHAELLTFDVRDKDHAYTEKIGLVNIRCDSLMSGNIKIFIFCLNMIKALCGKKKISLSLLKF